MRKNLFTLLSISLVILGSCTSKQMEEELTSPLSTTEDGVVTGVVSTQKDIELKALYEKAKHFKSELRSFNSPRQENALYRIADNVLNSNIFNLNGSRYQIEGTNPSGKKVRLTTHQSSVWTNYKSGDLFYIEALPSVAGIPYVIYQGSKDNKRPLGAGTLQKNGEKKSVAYIGPYKDNDSWFGRGWDIITTEKGLLFQNDMIYTKNDEPATMGNIENRVLSCSSYDNGRVMLVSQDEKDATQMFSILPQEKFRVLGIRYFADGSKVHNAIYDRDILKSIGDEVMILDNLSSYNTTNDNNYGRECRAKITKMSDVKVKKTYVNDTYQEVPVDMVFDKRVRQYSSYEEVRGMTFSALSNSKFILPTITHETLKYSPRDIRSSQAHYKANYIIRDLNGILYLLISPRTKATIEYTYSVYRVELPYLILLTPENSSSDKIVHAFGMWKGYLYTEQDSDKHSFHKIPIDNGDDDEIIFEMSNSDLVRMGYRESESELRSLTTSRKRIHL